ncbi:MAG: HAMP domain-containing histidine kinase [Eubacterium sp.]|nr:HAMP domain-containing histidine kinase [Eubacterium sp.]
MRIFIIICIVLLLLCVFLFIKLVLIKDSLKKLTGEIKKTREEDYNRETKVALIDRDVERLAAEINNNISFQKNMKLETEKSRRQLEQSISDIAHDLRTPLTVIKGNLQMLDKEAMSPEGREYLGISRRKAETLKSMVDEFFELSVLESEGTKPELKEINVVNLITEFIIENESLIRDHDLTPEISLPEETIMIMANRDMLVRVLGNLIGNIYKYAKDSFEIKVKRSEGCIIEVSNKVEDASSIDIDHIFDRTYRADKARTEGSAGLGLYIAKLLIERQNGTIEAKISNTDDIDRLVFEIAFPIK